MEEGDGNGNISSVGNGTAQQTHQLHVASADGSSHTTKAAPEQQSISRSNTATESADEETEDDTNKWDVDANALENFKQGGKAIKDLGRIMKKWYCGPILLWHKLVFLNFLVFQGD